ncbi:hypothetical protein LMG31841_04869 [Paraburkholderia saeva]|uniref:Uncharacterized protein n=1 Tax=Paraburkholderia saeva TaxID=2777537 RepID=A0A9N8X403_9BURK|nr:hypothetical protein LMG31841_04869 [Paraburkholderia saeva]
MVALRSLWGICVLLYGLDVFARGSGYHCDRRCHPIGLLVGLLAFGLAFVAYLVTSKFNRWRRERSSRSRF